MKFDFKVFKKGKPVYWIVGAIILFVIFYLLASGRSASSGSNSGGVTTVNAGPSDAQVAAGAQVQMAQIQANAAVNQAAADAATAQTNANAAVAIATLQAQADLANTQAGADIAKYTAGLDAQTQSQAITAQVNALQIQSEYSFATAKTAAETNLAIVNSNNALLSHQLDANNQALEIQSRNLIAQSLVAQIPSLKSGDRDAALISLATGAPSSHGSIQGGARAPSLFANV